MSTSDEPQIPERMYRKGRNSDPDFDQKEKLYHRFKQLQKASNGKFYPASIRFPDFSVNRERYSEPEDVLHPNYKGWGIVSFKVEELPEPIKIREGDKNETTYTFGPVHDPLEENFAHSEVRTYKNGQYSENMNVSNKEVKTQFRIHLANKLKFEKESEV